ncbi:MAG: hypothetical protein JRF70_13455 [Deltaproteobacteria bacterium]|nr:hypothetical protein [Deltaproteobacteria bacterium]
MGCCTTAWNELCDAAASVFCAGLCTGVSPFHCYSVKESKGTDKFQARTVNLDDDLEDKDFEAKKPVALCNPVNVSSPVLTIPALDLDEHLKAYAIKEAKGEPKHVKVQGIDLLVPNLLIVSSVDTSKPDRLLVPSTKSIIVPLSDTTHNIDHYKCYKAKTSKGTPKFVGAFFSSQDQFEPAKGYDLKKITRVCLPVDKDGEGIINPGWNLLCFSAKPTKGEEKHEARTRIHTNNQFGPEVLDTKKEDDLCLPAELFVP